MLLNFLRPRAGLVYPILSLLPSHSLAFGLELYSVPQQCSNLTIISSELNASTQYAALVVPYGPSPLPGGVEVRQVLEFIFDANSTTANVPINYPSGSQFVIAVSCCCWFHHFLLSCWIVLGFGCNFGNSFN